MGRQSISRVVPSPPFSSLTFPYIDYLKQRPYIFAAWFHLRKNMYLLRSRFNRTSALWKQMELGNDPTKKHLVEKVIPYNKNNVWAVSRDRTERIMNILRTIRGLNTKNSKILCIGPRNEAEILLMSLYGFSLENITGIDLFSYSPLIQVMDMHDLKFNDNQFDIVYSSFVLRYSNDIWRACAEAVRVTKDSGLIAIGTSFGRSSDLVGTDLNGGIKEILGYFGDHVKHIYWQEEFPFSHEDNIATVIFSISK